MTLNVSRLAACPNAANTSYPKPHQQLMTIAQRLLSSTLICLLGLLLSFDLSAQVQPKPSSPPAKTTTKPEDVQPQRLNKRIVQVSGLVVSGDDQVGVPGVNIFIPKAGRGTSTNLYGYFSIATLAGDSAVVSATGFRKQYYFIPDDGRQAISVIIYLKADTLLLPEIEIFPYPTEELFKQAVLSLKLPEAELANMHRNLDPGMLNSIRYNARMSSNENYRSYMSQEILRQETRYNAPSLQLLNPFAWNRFIKSVRRGDLKKKEYQKTE